MLGKRQKEDLNFLDFAFYSIGISTTTTFGDLVANSRLIRMLVCIQLLLSILVLANVTQSFLSKIKIHYDP
ncbi:TPA: two pore domain potassium channel family protein [Yersinia enterocolitica]|nr:two pore domain potassium channel family protein [Yersinia enterocolitica]